MKIIASDKTYIDYFHSVCALQNGLKCYGVRVREGLCSVLSKCGDRQPETTGKRYLVPVKFETLPIHVRMIVHRLNDLNSDLSDVLTGEKPFREAVDSSLESEIETVRP
jgi:hypothetical protein